MEGLVEGGQVCYPDESRKEWTGSILERRTGNRILFKYEIQRRRGHSSHSTRIISVSNVKNDQELLNQKTNESHMKLSNGKKAIPNYRSKSKEKLLFVLHFRQANEITI